MRIAYCVSAERPWNAASCNDSSILARSGSAARELLVTKSDEWFDGYKAIGCQKLNNNKNSNMSEKTACKKVGKQIQIESEIETETETEVEAEAEKLKLKLKCKTTKNYLGHTHIFGRANEMQNRSPKKLQKSEKTRNQKRNRNRTRRRTP